MDRWPYPRWVAHRGAGTLAPENTVEALEAGVRFGYRAVEIDAVLTADEVVVLLHDENLERTTDSGGSIAARTLRELAGVDAGGWFSRQFAGARIPTLRAYLARARELGVWVNVEIKPVPGFEPRTGEVVAGTVADLWPQADAQAPLLSSFSIEALQAARDAAPHLARAMLYDTVPAQWMQDARALGTVAVHGEHNRLSAPAAREIRGAGFGLMCYTVNAANRAQELFAWGVNAVCTDRLDLLVPVHATSTGATGAVARSP